MLTQSQGKAHLFAAGSASALTFQSELAKITTVFGPYAKAIQCLESPQTTCADVYLYWLALTSTINHVMNGVTVDLLDETKAELRAITNARFAQMINDAPNDPYVTAFYLHPGT